MNQERVRILRKGIAEVKEILATRKWSGFEFFGEYHYKVILNDLKHNLKQELEKA